MKILRNLFIAIFLSMLFTAGAQAKSDSKIGYVDLSRIFDEYHKTKAFDDVLEGEHKEFEDERNKRIEKIQKNRGKLDLLTDDKKTQLEEEIESMSTELLEFDRQKKADLTKHRNEVIREILLEIEKVVSDFADKENYSIILNDRVLIFGKENHDLTEQILETLNKSKKK